MPLDTVSFLSQSRSGSELPRVWAIVSSGPHETATAALAALAAADVVFHEDGADSAIMAHVPRGAMVEPVPADGHDVPARSAALARARRLAGDGWRVVWLTAGDAENTAFEFADAGPAVEERDATAGFAASMRTPHLLATALNGLAG
jgi:hypothetical protein